LRHKNRSEYYSAHAPEYCRGINPVLNVTMLSTQDNPGQIHWRALTNGT
jgi:hypothetical protein